MPAQRERQKPVTRKARVTVQDIRNGPAVVPFWPTAASAWGLSRSLAYELRQRGELPFRVVQLGRALRVTRAELLRSLGESDSAAEPAQVSA